ncbi:MAG: SPOR domain-containing protein [Alphaproteobacteria bacterium]
MPFPPDRGVPRLALAGIGLLSVAALATGCVGEKPPAYYQPKSAASKAASIGKLAGAPAIKPATIPAKPSGAPEQPPPAPLGPSNRLGPGYWIQLAAHFKVEGGEAAWKTLAARHRGLLAGEPHAVKRVDLGERGRFYRVLAGPYAAHGPAREKCASLKRAGVACFVITRRGRAGGAPVTAASGRPAAKPPATHIPSAAIKPGLPAAPRKAAITSTPAFARPVPRWLPKQTKKKTAVPAPEKKRAVDLPFQRRDSIPGATR